MISVFQAYLRRRLRRWLGVEGIEQRSAAANRLANTAIQRLGALQDGAADVSFRGNTQIIVITRLRGGMVQIYDLNTGTPDEIHQRAGAILGPAWPRSVIDAPPGFVRFARGRG